MAYDLNRFIQAQKLDYNQALFEICSGHKRSHWIWYIFPQIIGLGMSSTAVHYSIVDEGEAIAYMENQTLRDHLLEISDALLKLHSNDATDVMGFPDDMKLKSSMTLFAVVTPEYDVFQKVLDKFYGGEMDQKTLQILKEMRN